MCYYLLGRYGEAVATMTQGIPSERRRRHAGDLAILAAAYAQLGDTAAAARAKADLAKVTPFFDRELFISQLSSEADRAHLREGLAKAGIGG